MGSKIKYVYPIFDGINLGIFRIGGSGLGNLLHPFFRAIIYAKEKNLELIDPVFYSLKLKLILSNQIHKRSYKFHINKSIKGFKRFMILFKKKEGEFESLNAEIKTFKGFYKGFKPFYGYESYLLDYIKEMNNEDFMNYDKYKSSICCHIRLGDFKKQEDKFERIKNNTRIPISWFSEVIQFVKKKNQNSKVYIFSDGTKEELKEILKIPNTSLDSSINPISDILKMSSSKILIGSYSSFSMWASFFSNQTIIWHKDIFNLNEFPLNSKNYLFFDKSLKKIDYENS